ncbi:alpha-1,4-glucan lyase [Colletotrichum musicola]|uniref:alpha-glucosidase n=1 Tax=Colletotrichum musicola TaxID=2175873 RepID=A0A8H6K9B2_9PEZI|nr:alpha-1,4-glucan lyase [Colletotrichum musicola]
MSDPAADTKLRDPYIFKRAEDFFGQEVDGHGSGMVRPKVISYHDEDQGPSPGEKHPSCYRGAVFRFNDGRDGQPGSCLMIQFLRPRVWRLRFNPENRTDAHFSDWNTRTLIRDTTTELIKTLDEAEGIKWDVELIQGDQYYILQSVVIDPQTSEKVKEVQLWVQRNPFQITAVRVLKSLAPAEALPVDISAGPLIFENEAEGSRRAVIWKTKRRGLMYGERATVLALEKSITADFMGFGEQGGNDLFKKETYMNYFNFDNMKYNNVYGVGPQDDREPLYHSEPYWIEVDAQPGYQTQVATFIDNYSHICVDIGKTDATQLRVATRFNGFQGIFVAGDSIQEVIQLYTSIVGKPKLKPRYTLGYHQGCYGYDTQDMVLEAVKSYRAAGIPIDGVHIDIDMQDDYRTFTIDKRPGHFPDPVGMFSELRQLGVKCSTNITPYISNIPSDTYKTLNEGLANDFFVKDVRDLDPSAPGALEQRYIQYGTSSVYFRNPTVDKPEYLGGDPYNFPEHFNSGKPFHGGISYGKNLGHPGHYPNLNNKTVRKWWGKQYEYLFECGLDFVWQDMTSPCIAEQYGDMKSLPFRLKLDSDGWSGDKQETKRAIEIWSLYSYNLHKATYHGLNNIHKAGGKGKTNDKLKWREGRRNFIIGRGSFAGSHRFAGLWTGDNSSTWQFLKISVAQVLALGLGGVTISGADVGGFEPADHELNFANPELIIRWYGAYSLLPWFRNHYTRQRDWVEHPGQQRKGGKWFQEPYAYQRHYDEHKDQFSGREAEVYRAVLPTCRYAIRLRYALMQLLYDAMFENMVTGLPIARALPITDHVDRSLFSAENQHFTSSQYMVRKDLLVAPQLDQVGGGNPPRELYLPYPDHWFPFNLRPDEPFGVPLGDQVVGGQRIQYDCRISDVESQIPYTVPMYLREGAIIPKVAVRDFIPDPTTGAQPPNPITIHLYPGKANTYDMYLDDGISRDSAPSEIQMDSSDGQRKWYGEAHQLKHLADPLAKDSYTKVVFEQTVSKQLNKNNDNAKYTRQLHAYSPWTGFGGTIEDHIGTEYTFVFWHLPGSDLGTAELAPEQYRSAARVDHGLRATIFTVPVKDVHTPDGVWVSVALDGDI